MPDETETGTAGGAATPDADATGNRVGEEKDANVASGSGATPDGAGAEGGGRADGGGENLPPDDDNRGAGGRPEGASDSQPDRPAIQGVKRVHVEGLRGSQSAISKRDFVRAYKACAGNAAQVAVVLGIDDSNVRKRAARIPELVALYRLHGEDSDMPDAPTEITTIVRTPDSLPTITENSTLAEELMKQDRELMRAGLQAAGIKPETIERLKALDGLAVNAGRFLSASLDYTHRLHIYSTAALFEEMIFIRDNYLRPGEDGKSKLDPMTMVMWQRAYNEIADLLGRSYDRTLAGTQAMVAMMKANGDKDKPGGGPRAKPGW